MANNIIAEAQLAAKEAAAKAEEVTVTPFDQAFVDNLISNVVLIGAGGTNGILYPANCFPGEPDNLIAMSSLSGLEKSLVSYHKRTYGIPYTGKALGKYKTALASIVKDITTDVFAGTPKFVRQTNVFDKLPLTPACINLNAGIATLKPNPPVTPVKGSFSNVMRLILEMFGAQADILLGWIRGVLMRQHNYYHKQTPGSSANLPFDNFAATQVLSIIGDQSAGKSVFFGKILASILAPDGEAGAVSRSYLIGNSEFNSGLAPYTLFDDKQGFRTVTDREAAASTLKAIVAGVSVRIEQKGKDAFQSKFPIAMVVLSNCDLESIKAQPQFTNDPDKIIRLYAGHQSVVSGDKEEMFQTILKEMPALAYYLLHEYEVPAWAFGDKPVRYPVANYGAGDGFESPMYTDLASPITVAGMLQECITTAINSQCTWGVRNDGVLDPHKWLTSGEFQAWLNSKLDKNTGWSTKHLSIQLAKLSEARPDLVETKMDAKKCQRVFRIAEKDAWTADKQIANTNAHGMCRNPELYRIAGMPMGGNEPTDPTPTPEPPKPTHTDDTQVETEQVTPQATPQEEPASAPSTAANVTEIFPDHLYILPPAPKKAKPVRKAAKEYDHTEDDKVEDRLMQLYTDDDGRRLNHALGIYAAYSGGIVCPKCGNGSGDRGTGATFVPGSKHIKCHRCDEAYTIFSLTQDYLEEQGLPHTQKAAYAFISKIYEADTYDYGDSQQAAHSIYCDYEAGGKRFRTHEAKALAPAAEAAMKQSVEWFNRPERKDLRNFFANKLGLPVYALERKDLGMSTAPAYRANLYKGELVMWNTLDGQPISCKVRCEHSLAEHPFKVSCFSTDSNVFVQTEVRNHGEKTFRATPNQEAVCFGHDYVTSDMERVYITEGQSDTLAVYAALKEAGRDSRETAIARANVNHVLQQCDLDILAGKEVIYCVDPDDKGAATERNLENIKAVASKLKVWKSTDATVKDPREAYIKVGGTGLLETLNGNSAEL